MGQQAKVAKKVTASPVGLSITYWGGAKGDEQAILKGHQEQAADVGYLDCGSGTDIPSWMPSTYPFFRGDAGRFRSDNHLTKFVEGLMDAQGLVL